MMSAFVAPFAAFMALAWLEAQPALRSYYPILYAVKLAVVVGLLAAFWRCYPKFSTDGLWLGIGVGAVGAAVWIALAGVDLARWLPDPWRARLVGSRVGFDPDEIARAEIRTAIVALRLCGLALVVPVMEEIFWRGFLLRFLVREPFQSVSIGTYTVGSFVGVVALFTLAHTEWLAAAVWCAGVNLLLYRTHNLWSCIVAHAATNALLGAYILSAKQWHLW
jgi:hypothetical protein